MNQPLIFVQAPEIVPELTIIVPTFNERANLDQLVARLGRALGNVRWEAIFVDDNSPDGTAAALRAIGARDPRIRCIRRVGRRGLAGACIEGMLAAQSPVLAVIDADLQHDETQLPSMLLAMRNGADVVIATRYQDGAADQGFTAARSAMSRTATLIARRLLRVESSDPMSGFFMVRREIVEELAPDLSNQGYKILLDILASARPGLRVVEIPYVFGARQNGQSKLDSRVLLDFLGLLLAKVSGNLVSMRFVSFACVGALGLIVHLTILRLGLLGGAHFAVAQTVATLVAMTFNFLLNNQLTYRDRRLHGWGLVSGLVKFCAICGLGAFANIGLASWMFIETSRWWVAGLSGSIVGAAWNYGFSNSLVWADAA